MAQSVFRAGLLRFLRGEEGSARVSAVLFAIALGCCAVMAVLGTTGVLAVPLLIYLVFGVAAVAAGFDAWREWRNDKRS
jgi:hypothetical protein